jgi:hypothetical protein
MRRTMAGASSAKRRFGAKPAAALIKTPTPPDPPMTGPKRPPIDRIEDLVMLAVVIGFVTAVLGDLKATLLAFAFLVVLALGTVGLARLLSQP